MKIALVYVSPNGTTESTSIVIKEKLIEKGHNVQLFNIGKLPYREEYEFVVKEISKFDIVGFGSPVYHMDMLSPMLDLMNILSMSCDQYSAVYTSFLNVTYAGITSGKALINAYRKMNLMGVPVTGALKVCAPHFHHKKKYPDSEIERTISKFIDTISERGFTAMGHKHAIKILKPEKRCVQMIYLLVHFVGKKRELPINIAGSQCILCKKCIRECPVGAISMQGIPVIDVDKCIHCYHCVIACKLGLIMSPIEKIDQVIKVNKKIIGLESPINNIYV